MEELAKIVRVLKKANPDAPHSSLLVLDATTGQNALRQVEAFNDMISLTGLIMTKLDGTAKGGILVAVADKFKLPLHYIGVGEQIDDLEPFAADEFAKALLGV
jgi:fused signal recognition particle receptor